MYIPRLFYETGAQQEEMPIASVEAKFKLSQNKDDADRAGVMRALEARDDGRELARFAAAYHARRR